LEDIRKENTGAQRDAHRLNCVHDRADDMRRCLEAVWPNEIHEVEHRVLAAQAGNTERKVLHDGTRRLPVDKITVC